MVDESSVVRVMLLDTELHVPMALDPLISPRDNTQLVQERAQYGAGRSYNYRQSPLAPAAPIRGLSFSGDRASKYFLSLPALATLPPLSAPVRVQLGATAIPPVTTSPYAGTATIGSFALISEGPKSWHYRAVRPLVQGAAPAVDCELGCISRFYVADLGQVTVEFRLSTLAVDKWDNLFLSIDHLITHMRRPNRTL